MQAETNQKKSFKRISVYYDGLCHLCSREINHYQKMTGAEQINFIDITTSAFDAKVERLDPVQIHKTMHVKDEAGKVHTGVDAFICIWKNLPTLQFLVPIAKFPPMRLLLDLFYFIFAKIRPLLPRKSCETSPYCETKPK